jgi:hypothetical protein
MTRTTPQNTLRIVLATMLHGMGAFSALAA